MTNKIGVEIEATLGSAGVDAGLDRIVQKIDQANKTTIDPVSDKAIGKVDAIGVRVDRVSQAIGKANKSPLNPVSDKSISNVDKLFQQLKRVDPELRRRAKASGQENSSFEEFNFSSAGYHAKKIRAIHRYVGADGGLAQGGTPTPGGGPPSAGGGFGGVAMGAAQAGLRAAGPAGGVAAGAINTGMASGAGAGLMGLMGGMLALGVGKLVSGVMEKLENAENNAVAYDKLKRVLGDVSVSFVGLKTAVQGSAKNMSLTFDETARLSTQFAKSAGLSGDQYKTLPDELKNGVGLSRAFGLDPAQGVGVMGQMRGIGVTKDVQDSRRFALLIGETIGKSGAFAKADEVMEAMSSYATNQTRNNMGAANVSGYAGSLSALIGSGIPGMDPTGASALLGRINSALSGGGAKGEASQFFTGQVGNSMGLNHLQTQVLREGGSYATNDKAFGKDSTYQRYMGKEGPKGSTTFLQGTMEMINKQYSGDDDQSKLLRAQAFANHAGINMNQAMGMLSVKPNQMNELEKYAGDLSKMSGTGISNLTNVRFGTADKRQDVARQYLGRTGADALNEKDRSEISGAMGNDEELKRVLSGLAAKYDQERTQGSDIRDSKNALDNLKTSMADKLVPYTQDIRAGILWMASDGKKTGDEMLKDIAKAESGMRAEQLKGGSNGERIVAEKESRDRIEALDQKRKENDSFFRDHGPSTLFDPNTPAPVLEEYKRRADEGQKIDDAILQEKRLLSERKKQIDASEVAKLAEENNRLKKEIVELDARAEDKRRMQDAEVAAREEQKRILTQASAAEDGGNQSRAETNRFTRKGTGGSGGGGAALDTAPLDDKLDAAEKRNGLQKGVLKSVMQQETGGKQAYLEDPAKYHYPLNSEGKRIAGHTGKVSTAFGPFGILESTAAKPGYGVTPLKDKSIDEQIRFSSEYLAARSRSAGSLEAGLSGYGEGPAYGRKVMSRIPAPGVATAARTPLPDTPGAGPRSESTRDEMRIRVDPLVITHENQRGEQIMPSQTVQTRLFTPNPRIGGGA